MASVKNILPHILNGQNASVFAYGPTGAGMLPSFALHTMFIRLYMYCSGIRKQWYECEESKRILRNISDLDLQMICLQRCPTIVCFYSTF